MRSRQRSQSAEEWTRKDRYSAGTVRKQGPCKGTPSHTFWISVSNEATHGTRRDLVSMKGVLSFCSAHKETEEHTAWAGTQRRTESVDALVEEV